MTQREIRRRRLTNQGIAEPRFASPRAVISWFGAVQAQDYAGACWAVGLRMKRATEKDVERALTRGTIVRSWPLRGTLHFVAAEDLKWMLQLLSRRVSSRHSTRLLRYFELDAATLTKCRREVIRVLQGDRRLTRPEVYSALEAVGIRTAASRGLHILFTLGIAGVICFGPPRDRQPTFVLLDEWITTSRALDGDEALHELAHRYFRSHSPATVADFAWWAGLSMFEARRAAEMVGTRQRRVITTRSVHLLPPFDEYLVAYKDRGAVLDAAYLRQVNAGGGLLNPTVVSDGEVIGTWKRALKNGSVAITANLFRPLEKSEEQRLNDAKSRYAAFLGVPDSRR